MRAVPGGRWHVLHCVFPWSLPLIFIPFSLTAILIPLKRLHIRHHIRLEPLGRRLKEAMVMGLVGLLWPSQDLAISLSTNAVRPLSRQPSLARACALKLSSACRSPDSSGSVWAHGGGGPRSVCHPLSLYLSVHADTLGATVISRGAVPPHSAGAVRLSQPRLPARPQADCPLQAMWEQQRHSEHRRKLSAWVRPCLS